MERQFSILLPTFNSMKFIQPCVTSILTQRCRNFILHVVDGGSTDETLQYIRSLEDDRIRLYTSNERLSIEENWQRFVSLPKNEYMTIIGHDDVYESSFLDEINQLIEEYPAASLFHTHFNYIDQFGNIVRECERVPSVVFPEQFLKGILTGAIDIMATGFVMRSSDYESINGIPLFPKLLFADDALWLQLVQKGYLVVSQSTCFSFRYHQNTSNVLLGETTLHALGDYTNFLQEFKVSNEKLGRIIEEYGAPYIFARCKEIVIRIIRKPLKNRNNITARDVITGCKRYAEILSKGHSIDPFDDKSLRLASFIDSNPFTRNLFILFKRFYKKPVIK